MKKGFTLIELLLVVAIVTILAALLIPACQSTSGGISRDSNVVGVRDKPTSNQSDSGKLKLIGETDKTSVYEFISDDNRKCIMVESKYVDEDTTINCK